MTSFKQASSVSLFSSEKTADYQSEEHHLEHLEMAKPTGSIAVISAPRTSVHDIRSAQLRRRKNIDVLSAVLKHKAKRSTWQIAPSSIALMTHRFNAQLARP
jgi:hypothetical protein